MRVALRAKSAQNVKSVASLVRVLLDITELQRFRIIYIKGGNNEYRKGDI